MIETSQLQTLVAVARAKSFSRAAEELNVTQSAISQSIKNLENKIDAKIFERSGKNVVLTPQGERLFHLAQGFLSQLGEALQEIHNEKENVKGKVRIGTVMGIGKAWMAPELLEYAKENPDLIYSLHMGFQDDILRDFENYRLDVLLVPEEDAPINGIKEFFLEEKAALVFPKGNPFNISEKMTIQDLEKVPTVLFENDDHMFLKWCKAKFGQTPRKINVRYVVNSHGNMLQAVRDGLGVAVIPMHVLNRSYLQDQVETLGERFEISNGRLALVYHEGANDLARIQYTVKRLMESRKSF